MIYHSDLILVRQHNVATDGEAEEENLLEIVVFKILIFYSLLLSTGIEHRINTILNLLVFHCLTYPPPLFHKKQNKNVELLN